MRQRQWKFNVYLDHEEKLMLKRKAEKTGLSISALVRSLIMDFEPKEKPDEYFYEALNGIRKVGNVLNQIAARAHHTGYIEDEKYLREMMTRLNDLIVNIKEYYLLPDKIDKDNVI